MSKQPSEQSLWNIPVTDIHDKKYAKFSDMFNGDIPQVTMIVNVASKCGHTKKHYEQMTQLYSQYHDQGFEIVAFPCNQFGSQESKPNETIYEFVCDSYDVKFPMMDKIKVNDADAHEVYRNLKSQAKVGKIPWNFAKFLGDQSGSVIQYGDAKQMKPIDFIPLIEQHLKSANNSKNVGKKNFTSKLAKVQKNDTESDEEEKKESSPIASEKRGRGRPKSDKKRTKLASESRSKSIGKIQAKKQQDVIKPNKDAKSVKPSAMSTRGRSKAIQKVDTIKEESLEESKGDKSQKRGRPKSQAGKSKSQDKNQDKKSKSKTGAQKRKYHEKQ
eukprot:403341431